MSAGLSRRGRRTILLLLRAWRPSDFARNVQNREGMLQLPSDLRRSVAMAHVVEQNVGLDWSSCATWRDSLEPMRTLPKLAWRKIIHPNLPTSRRAQLFAHHTLIDWNGPSDCLAHGTRLPPHLLPTVATTLSARTDQCLLGEYASTMNDATPIVGGEGTISTHGHS